MSDAEGGDRAAHQTVPTTTDQMSAKEPDQALTSLDNPDDGEIDDTGDASRLCRGEQMRGLEARDVAEKRGVRVGKRSGQ